ncbi:type IV CRISPR-associated protein Csf1 (plasmid) [Burkholderia aenigmatica]|uniref:type IV CRISPR-associated protein Csf1 n=1 Tax=Burkholderia aenigmatica TaxID=2015348 RepID=UPI003B42EBED
MNAMISPSRLAATAAGLGPIESAAARTPGCCAMCGHGHAIGDPVAPFEPDASFTDYGALRAPASRVICGWCAVTWSADFTQRYTKSVICSEGVFPAASNEHIAYWLLNPPAGQWIFMQSDQKRQHLVWRMPVNTSREVFTVRYGELLLTVRRSYLEEGTAAAKRLAAAATTNRKVRGAALKSPFVRLSRDLSDPAHGAIRADLYELAESDSEVKKDIAFIHSLTAGEIWGLTATLYVSDPQRPERKLPATAAQK